MNKNSKLLHVFEENGSSHAGKYQQNKGVSYIKPNYLGYYDIYLYFYYRVIQLSMVERQPQIECYLTFLKVCGLTFGYIKEWAHSEIKPCHYLTEFMDPEGNSVFLILLAGNSE